MTFQKNYLSKLLVTDYHDDGDKFGDKYGTVRFKNLAQHILKQIIKHRFPAKTLLENIHKDRVIHSRKVGWGSPVNCYGDITTVFFPV